MSCHKSDTGKERIDMRSFDDYLEESLKDGEFADALKEASAELDFGVALAMRREELGKTQTEIARSAGLKQPMLARIERGQMPKAVTLQKLAKVLEVEIVFNGETVSLRPVDELAENSAVEVGTVTQVAEVEFRDETLGEILLSNVVNFSEFKKSRQPITANLGAAFEDEYEGIKSFAH